MFAMLADGREIDAEQRTVKHHDNIGDGKHVGLRLPLLAAVMSAVGAFPPQTNTRPIKNERGRKPNHKLLAPL